MEIDETTRDMCENYNKQIREIDFNSFEENIIVIKYLIHRAFSKSKIRIENLLKAFNEKDKDIDLNRIYEEVGANEFLYSTLMNSITRMRDYVRSKIDHDVDGEDELRTFLKIKTDFYKNEFECAEFSDTDVYFKTNEMTIFQNRNNYLLVSHERYEKNAREYLSSLSEFENIAGIMVMKIYKIEKFVDRVMRSNEGLTVLENEPCYLNRLIKTLNIRNANLDAVALHVGDLMGCIHSHYYDNKELIKSLFNLNVKHTKMSLNELRTILNKNFNSYIKAISRKVECENE